MRKYVICIAVLVGLTWSCSEYQNLLKTNDYDLKYTKALEYFRAGDYRRSLVLLDDIKTIYSGTSKAQLIAYHRAFCNYYMKDYALAAELFKNIALSYPGSSLVEEVLYMAPYCEYLASPRFLLDQEVSDLALNDFQFFLDRYPNSSRKDTVNYYMDRLRDKLSYKAYMSARNYYIRGYYPAAVIGLENCLRDYPGTKYREDIMYMLFNAKYEVAVNSVEHKKLDRYNEAKEEYYYFLEEYPNTPYAKELKKKYKEIDSFLRNYDFNAKEEIIEN